MADNPNDRPYAKTAEEGATQRGQTRYAKAIPIVTQEDMKHNVLPLAAARAARKLALGRANGSISKANARSAYLNFLKQEFVIAKKEFQNVP